MPYTTTYIADKIFTGQEWLTGHAVTVTGERIENILPVSALPADSNKEIFTGCFIAPSFIDVQIYGAYEKLLAVYPEAASLAALNEYCRSGGAAFCLPTVATNSYATMYRCIDAVKAYWQAGGKGVFGVHLEGPWINVVRKGAHIASLIHPPDIEEVKKLVTYAEGCVKMITLAPEVCSKQVIDYLLANDIVISAGHSNANYQQAIESFSNGITAVTHLYNAMSPLQHRAPGLVGAAMNSDTVMAAIIPDGYHVDYAAISIAKKIMQQRLFVITDAVTTTTIGEYQHVLAGDKYESAGILSGSALTMNKAVNNLVQYAGIDLGEALRMCSLYPAQVINMDKQLGKIGKGYKASLVVMNEKNEVIKLID